MLAGVVESAFGVTQRLEAHHHMGAQAAQCHHLFGGSRFADRVPLVFEPHQQFLGLISPCRKSSSQ